MPSRMRWAVARFFFAILASKKGLSRGFPMSGLALIGDVHVLGHLAHALGIEADDRADLIAAKAVPLSAQHHQVLEQLDNAIEPLLHRVAVLLLRHVLALLRA